ncbi:21319_t:CDS:2, partial [Gigaspora rosea]
MREVELKVMPIKSGDKRKKFNVDDMDEPCNEDKDEIKKDDETNRIMSVNSKFTGETTINKMEAVLTGPGEIVGGKNQEENNCKPSIGDEGEVSKSSARREVIQNTEYTETVNKVNVPEVYRKKAEESLYENGDGKGKAKGNLKAQVRLGSCYQKRSRTQEEVKSDGMTGFERLEKNERKEINAEDVLVNSGEFKAEKLVETKDKMTYGEDWETWVGENYENNEKIKKAALDRKCEEWFRKVEEFWMAICKIKSIESKLAKRIIQVDSCNQKEVETDGHEAIDNYPRSAKK